MKKGMVVDLLSPPCPSVEEGGCGSFGSVQNKGSQAPCPKCQGRGRLPREGDIPEPVPCPLECGGIIEKDDVLKRFQAAATTLGITAGDADAVDKHVQGIVDAARGKAEKIITDANATGSGIVEGARQSGQQIIADAQAASQRARQDVLDAEKSLNDVKAEKVRVQTEIDALKAPKPAEGV